MNKIKSFFSKNYKFILFCIIFIITCIISNINNQDLNHFLKKGTVLEYSLTDKNISAEDIEKKLADEGIKYGYVNFEKNKNSQIYDSDNSKIENLLQIGIPVIADNNKTLLFNNISDFIFENSPNSKLLEVKTIDRFYHKPFRLFVNLLEVTFISIFVWLILLYLTSNDKNFWKSIFKEIKNFITNKKDSFKNYIKKVKEKGLGYFIKTIFFEEAKDENGEEKEPDITKELISTILFVLVCVILIRYFIGELRWIPSGSMRLTILERDRVFVEKLNFPKKEIKRGDILVFYPPEARLKNDPISIFSRLSGIGCKDIAFIKRAIGMPNDKFEVKLDEKSNEYRVFINNVALNEPYINSKTDWSPCTSQMFCGPFIIPEGHYFMMGDNRGNSQDSRFWGFLDKNRIIGRANFMFWPISRINILNDKYLDLHKEKINGEYVNQKYIVNRYELLYKI